MSGPRYGKAILPARRLSLDALTGEEGGQSSFALAPHDQSSDCSPASSDSLPIPRINELLR